MAKISDARIKANAAYNLRAYDQIALRAEKRLRMPERIKAAADKQSISSRQYLLAVIGAALDADGITLDDLPPAAPQDEKQADEE